MGQFAWSTSGLDHEVALGAGLCADRFCGGPPADRSQPVVLEDRPIRSGQFVVRMWARQRSACGSRRCRLLTVWSVHVQAVRPCPANESPTDDQEGLTASGDQASDLDFLVAGAGFEPATSG